MTAPAVFADTSFNLTALRADDPAHPCAIAESRIPRQIITTEFVILEMGSAMSRASALPDFLALVEMLRSTRRISVVPLGSSLMERGLRRMAERPDKDWSLIDCISFIVMEEMSIVEALTTDHHFEQAGFRALLKTK